ncbi:MFS transporter [Nonomuraea sp. SBT364]|uniref:MFS transporter n=1 Tax=Nonomuraea sp. SBT364 TaxID=1580530 RepID=UPI00066E9BC6|nr:MFS transporter [Nonomuraea sp. SBT364]
MTGARPLTRAAAGGAVTGHSGASPLPAADAEQCIDQGRNHDQCGIRTVLTTGFAIQAAATASLFLLGDDRGSLALLLVATFIGGVGNMLAIVGFMVAATSGLADSEQGLATGLATMTQQIGITMGIPIMSAVTTAGMAGGGTVLEGVSAAILVNAALVLTGAVLAWLFLRRPAN